MFLYNPWEYPHLLYLDLQSEYNKLSLHLFFDPGLATDRKLPRRNPSLRLLSVNGTAQWREQSQKTLKNLV
jgi:hypothetical protein